MRRLVFCLALFGCAPPELASDAPQSSTLNADVIRWHRLDRVDVLFVLDNTASMAEKASLVNEAVPAMVGRLASTQATRDVHVGFITSSLGSFGGDICAGNPANSVGEKNDHAHLQGFLDWAPGATSLAVTNAANTTAALSYAGCGMEAPLEAWYRFLVDPEPPAEIVLEGGLASAEGIDQILLTQRRDFLRPDSFLLIVMLTDENDCSVDFRGQGWIVGQASGSDGPFVMPPGTSACQKDPQDPCCRSCASTAAPEGCLSLDDDPACDWDPEIPDPLGLRCFDQKRRFGIDYLHPTRRYVDALRQPHLTNAAGETFANPLMQDTRSGYPIYRDMSSIHLVLIAGVPWQDIATEESLTDPSLIEYLNGIELLNDQRWDWLTPKCREVGANGTCEAWDLRDEPSDPLLAESVEPRDGKNPATNTPLVAPFGGYLEQPINGHERRTSNDLQYSCIYPLSEPRDCTDQQNCPCRDAPAVPGPWYESDPVCQTTRGFYSRTQRFARAFPPTRQLEVARDLLETSSVASICPKFVDTPASDQKFAYNPALDGVIDRLFEAPIDPTYCLKPTYPFQAIGVSGCRVLVDASQLSVCGCESPGFRPVSATTTTAAQKILGLNNACGTPTTRPCSLVCICELEPTTGSAAVACEAGADASVPGYCGLSAGVSERCTKDRNALRFVGLETSYTLLIHCL